MCRDVCLYDPMVYCYHGCDPCGPEPGDCTAPSESQLQLDDPFADMLDRLAEIVEFTPEKSDAEQVHDLREFVWEFLARTLLLKGEK